jgi:flagellar biosynthesis/type III secretory pathway protein FliH
MADMRRDGFEEGLQQGHEQGAYQKALETAKAMCLDKVPVETISKYTNLPLDVVQNLIQAQ